MHQKKPAHESDEHLVKMLTEGNELAFDHIYKKYWESVYVRAYKILQDEDTCQDLVQDIFISLWTKRLTISINNLSAYLHQAAKLRVFQYLRDGKTAQRHLDQMKLVEAQDTLQEQLQFDETNQLLMDALSELPEKCREVFQLSRFEQLSHKEIAERLDISTKTVENHITKALKHIRLYIKELIILFYLLM